MAKKTPADEDLRRRTSAAKQQLVEAAVGSQKRTFTRWINVQLTRGKSDARVDDLFKDLCSGVILQKLIGVLSPGVSLRRKTGKGRMSRISNLNEVLEFLRKEAKLRLINIDAEDLFEGKENVTLGLIWPLVLIQHYQLAAQASASATTTAEMKKSLLQWCQACLNSGYAGVRVVDLTRSWRDGLAFSALLDHHRAGVVDFAALSAADADKNLRRAFELGERHFNIPQLLDPQDVNVKSPDEKSIMTYQLDVRKELEPLRPVHGDGDRGGDGGVAAAMADTLAEEEEPKEDEAEAAGQQDASADNAELLEYIQQQEQAVELRRSEIPHGDVAALRRESWQSSKQPAVDEAGCEAVPGAYDAQHALVLAALECSDVAEHTAQRQVLLRDWPALGNEAAADVLS